MTTFPNTLASDFLRLRAEASDALATLAALAGESLATFAHVERLRSLRAEWLRPILIVVAGEKKSGKSTLIDAFLGQERAPVTPPAEGRLTIILKHRETVQDIPLEPDLIERRLPEDFLRDFTIVEAADPAAITGPFGQTADLLLIVLSIADPWAESVWRQMETLPKSTLDKTIIVLQHKDLREERELQAISGHLRQMASRKTGRALPVFPVSAKEALLARTAGLDKPRLWTESRFGALENHLNDRVGSPDGAGGALRRVCAEAQTILADVAAQAQATEQSTAADRDELTRLREAIRNFRQQAEAQAPAFRQEIDAAAAHGQEQGEHLLAQRLRGRNIVRLMTGDKINWQKEFHRNISSIMRAAAVKQIEGALRILENELNAAWEQFDAAQDALSPESQRRFILDAAVFEGSCAHLVEEIELTVVERMADDGTETRLRDVFARLTYQLWLALAAMLAGAVGALGVAWLGHINLAGGLMTAAIAQALMGKRSLAQRRREALGLYHAQMSARREELARAVVTPIQEAIDAFCLKLNDLLQPVEDFCVAQDARSRPMLDRVRSLSETFRHLAARG